MRRFTSVLSSLIVSASVVALAATCAHAGASIRTFGPQISPPRHDFVKFHGRIIPSTPIDPGTETIHIRLTNSNGLIYSVDIPAGTLEANRPFGAKKWKFKDTSARTLGPASTHHGVFRMRVKKRQEELGTAYPFFLTAYGDLSEATLSVMTFQIQFGDDVGAVTRPWEGAPGRWKLREGAF